MPRNSKNTRYDALLPDEWHVLKNPHSDVVLEKRMSSFTGRPENLSFYLSALESFEGLVKDWSSGPLWVRAFIYFSNSANRTSSRTYSTILTLFRNGFYAFVVERGEQALALEDISAEYISQFELWLKKREVVRSDGERIVQEDSTARKLYGAVNLLLEELRSRPLRGVRVPPRSVFRKKAFPGAHLNGRNSPRVLSMVEWDAIYLAARREALLIKEQVERDWALLDDNRPQAAKLNRNDRLSVLRALQPLAENRIVPSIQDLFAHDRKLGSAVVYLRYRDVVMCFSPSVETIFPFVLLMGMYAVVNTGPLRSVKVSRISEVTVLGGTRLVWDFIEMPDDELDESVESGKLQRRTVFEWDKRRIHNSYPRSFAVDPADPLSPDSILKFMLRWTADIRNVAGKYVDHLFIFANHIRVARAFLTAEHDGKDSDTCWNHAIEMFRKRNQLPHFNISNIRVTGLNRIDELFPDDPLAVKVAAGHKRGSTTYKMHYEGDGARMNNNERLASVSRTMHRFATTGGRADIRAAPDGTDTNSATPGWHCSDPYTSPIPGQVLGTLCFAFGQCPACPHGMLDQTSPYAIARALQLRVEIDKALSYLEFSRWSKVYAPVRKKLDEVWLPQASPFVLDKARQLSLGPIGGLE